MCGSDVAAGIRKEEQFHEKGHQSDGRPAAGVSHVTVSRVHLVTRARVIETARRMGYPLAPADGRRTVAIIIFEINLFGCLGSLLSFLQEEISLHGYRVELISSRDLELLSSRAIAGTISVSINDHLNEFWGEFSNLPLVRLNRPTCHRENICSVSSDGIAGMELTVDYLFRQGHRKIGFISDVHRADERVYTSHRYEGFCDALRRRDVDEPEVFCFFRDQGRFPDLRRWGECGVTALIAAGETNSLSVAQQLNSFRIKVPEELSVFSMEFPGISERLIPAHTTLSQDFRGLVREAITLLDRLIGRKPVAGDVRVPYLLIERESVKTLV